MEPRHFLRVEGLVVLGASLGAYLSIEGSIPLLVVLAIAPDLSMLGYLAGPRAGSLVYNVVHTYTLPLLLGAVGVLADARLPLLVALIWAGHIGADRLFGYGLEFETGFSATHLSSQPAPVAAFEESA